MNNRLCAAPVPGEAEALSRYSKLVDRIARNLWHKNNRSGRVNLFDVEDFVSYGMIGLLQAIRTRNNELSEFEWVRFACANIHGSIIDSLRGLFRRFKKNSPNQRRMLNIINAANIADHTDAIGSQHETSSLETSDELSVLLDQLPERHQICIREVFFCYKTHQNIGDQLGLSRPYVTQLIQQSLNMLRQQAQKSHI